MKKYILFLCLFGCSADISSEPMEEKYGTYPELPEPKLMEPYKPHGVIRFFGFQKIQGIRLQKNEF